MTLRRTRENQYSSRGREDMTGRLQGTGKQQKRQPQLLHHSRLLQARNECRRDAKQQHITHQTQARIRHIHGPPRQTRVACTLIHLPPVRPITRYGQAMEDQEHQLAQEDATKKDPGGLDGALDPGGAAGEAPVEGEAGEAAEEEGACVEDVGGKVEDFGFVDGGVGEDVLYILYMAAGPEADENDGKGNEGGEWKLEQG